MMDDKSRYIVGIDLGTTNCAVSYIDTKVDTEQPKVDLLRIPQVTDTSVVEGKVILPSFLYMASEKEFPEKSLALPWAEDVDSIIGEFARKRGAEVPLRLVSSAKSWLCNPNVDKTSPVLPWNGPEEIRKISPLEASAQFLAHIRMAWDYAMSEGGRDLSLERQNIFITVPASFDTLARDLTVRAAAKAGLSAITLLEEPQAAFYAWINRKDEEWRRQVKVGDVILVCDIGGGTTDFSIIEVEDEAGELVLKRVAVGEHILLGGDNMDLTLAYSMRSRFMEKNIKLDTHQMLGLVYSCREAKERMLNEPDCKQLPIVILGRGRSVIGGSVQTSLKRSEVDNIIIEGFFPKCDIMEAPQEMRASGFRELGLQYAADTAITKYLARFLRLHANKREGTGEEQGFIWPTKVLFNGGVTKASAIRDRIMQVLNEWLINAGATPAQVLYGNDPDLAVAVGAAYYGFAKTGKGIRIRAGAGRSYYIGIESSMPAVPGMPAPLKALCVVPFGMEEGSDFPLPGHEFGLIVGEQAAFRFFSSIARKEDSVGSVIEEWEESELEELPSLETALPAEGIEPGTLVPVRLHSYLTETGTLELWCEASDRTNRWKLEFNVREGISV